MFCSGDGGGRGRRGSKFGAWRNVAAAARRFVKRLVEDRRKWRQDVVMVPRRKVTGPNRGVVLSRCGGQQCAAGKRAERMKEASGEAGYCAAMGILNPSNVLILRIKSRFCQRFESNNSWTINWCSEKSVWPQKQHRWTKWVLIVGAWLCVCGLLRSFLLGVPFLVEVALLVPGRCGRWCKLVSGAFVGGCVMFC